MAPTEQTRLLPPLRGGAATPKHAQVRDALAQMAREVGPDQVVPSERELMAEYDVSRATVRRAIETLIGDGLLHRVPGKGTYVAPARIESHLHLASFTEDMLRRGRTPSTRVLSLRLDTPPDAAAEFFGLPATGQAWRVERLRLADGESMAYEIGWISTALAPELGTADLTTSLYAALERQYGVVVDSAEQVVWAECADQARARVLGVPLNSPLMVFERRSRSRGLPLEYVVSWYRGDRYRVHISLDSTMPTD